MSHSRPSAISGAGAGGAAAGAGRRQRRRQVCKMAANIAHAHAQHMAPRAQPRAQPHTREDPGLDQRAAPDHGGRDPRGGGQAVPPLAGTKDVAVADERQPGRRSQVRAAPGMGSSSSRVWWVGGNAMALLATRAACRSRPPTGPARLPVPRRARSPDVLPVCAARVALLPRAPVQRDGGGAPAGQLRDEAVRHVGAVVVALAAAAAAGRRRSAARAAQARMTGGSRGRVHCRGGHAERCRRVCLLVCCSPDLDRHRLVGRRRCRRHDVAKAARLAQQRGAGAALADEVDGAACTGALQAGSWLWVLQRRSGPAARHGVRCMRVQAGRAPHCRHRQLHPTPKSPTRSAAHKPPSSQASKQAHKTSQPRRASPQLMSMKSASAQRTNQSSHIVIENIHRASNNNNKRRPSAHRS